MAGLPEARLKERATILAVDDAPENLALMNRLLGDRYKVKVATNGEKALRIAGSEEPPDLILLDVVMPGMDGYEVCRRIMAEERTRHIPVIFLTARSEADDERFGLELGAVDYIAKPISPPIVMARVKTHLAQKLAAEFLRDNNAFLEQEVMRRTRELQAIQDVTIMTITSLAETRDNDTGHHIRRTQIYLRTLAEKLGTHPRFSDALTASMIETLFKSAPLHDVGKVGIPDRILLKPGRFEPEEFETMKTHCALGYEAIDKAEKQLGFSVDFLSCAKEIAYFHHEKWDGSGYPTGRAGSDIPLSARLMAIADVYDALTCRRVYKAAMPHEKAVEVIVAGRGSHFDPDIVDAFLDIHETFRAVALQYQDADGAAS